MFCHNCGAYLPNEAKFCTECGEKTINSLLNESLSAESPPVESPSIGFLFITRNSNDYNSEIPVELFINGEREYYITNGESIKITLEIGRYAISLKHRGVVLLERIVEINANEAKTIEFEANILDDDTVEQELSRSTPITPIRKTQYKTCKKCRSIIDPKAKKCPYCGARVKPGAGRIILGIIILLFGISLFSHGVSDYANTSSSISSAGSKTHLSSTLPNATTNEKEDNDSISTGQNIFQYINNASSKVKLEEVTPPSIAVGDFGIKTINGSMKNVSGKTITYAQILFALFDSDGAQIGTAVANINNLTANSVWKYSASPLILDNWVSFELTEITSW